MSFLRTYLMNRGSVPVANNRPTLVFTLEDVPHRTSMGIFHTPFKMSVRLAANWLTQFGWFKDGICGALNSYLRQRERKKGRSWTGTHLVSRFL